MELRLPAAFAAGVTILAVAAWFAVRSGAEYLDAARRAERLGDAAHAVAHARLAWHELAAAAPADGSRTATLLGAGHHVARAAADTEGEADLGTRLAALARTIATPADGAGAGGDVDAPAVARDLRSIDEAVLLRQRQARESVRAAAEQVRNTAWLLGILVIMALSGAYAFVMSGVRERRRLIARLRQSVNHDPLTGLPNRRFFGEWLGYAIAHARREVRHVALLFVDIDGIRAVDELHGKADADALLIEIARRFRETAREGDVLARIGPCEFALAIPDITDPREAAPLAQRLRDALADPARPPLADTPIGASVGVAFYPGDAQDPAGVMAAADAAVVAAKDAGRNRVAFKPLAKAA